MSELKYVYMGSAVGAAAQFYRLDDVRDLDIVIPAQAACALPVTGGKCAAQAPRFQFDVEYPRPRTLLSYERIDTTIDGREAMGRYETDIDLEVESITVVDKLRVGLVKLNLLSSRDPASDHADVSTKGNRIEGMTLGNVRAEIAFDEEPLGAASCLKELAGFYQKLSDGYRKLNSWRFGLQPDQRELPADATSQVFSLVREIRLSGPEDELRNMYVDGYTIVWEGFGRIILGEVHVENYKRRVTLVRLAMGSDAGGQGAMGDGQSNGQVGN